MKIPKAFAAGLLVWLCAGPMFPLEEFVFTAVDMEFEQDGEKHPTKLEMFLPIARPIEGSDGGPLTIRVQWDTSSYEGEDPRWSKGKLSAVVKIYRNDKVIWNVKMKGKIHRDHSRGLFACNAIDFALLEGDVVVSNVNFKGMPLFNEGDWTYLWMSVEPYVPEGLANDRKYCKY